MTTSTRRSGGFSEAERDAMKARAEELKAERGGKKKSSDLQNLLDKIAEMPESDRVMAERIHAVVTDVAPQLSAKTWYGMPAYADADGKVVCFFKAADKFGARYAELGFNDAAHLDDGAMWPTAYALTELTDDGVALIESLVARAVA